VDKAGCPRVSQGEGLPSDVRQHPWDGAGPMGHTQMMGTTRDLTSKKTGGQTSTGSWWDEGGVEAQAAVFCRMEAEGDPVPVGGLATFPFWKSE
jgi:hypothetical protein